MAQILDIYFDNPIDYGPVRFIARLFSSMNSGLALLCPSSIHPIVRDGLLSAFSLLLYFLKAKIRLWAIILTSIIVGLEILLVFPI